MNGCNKINSIEKLNLENLIDRIWEEYKEERYANAVKLSQKGLVSAAKTNDRQWVKMFDALCKEMIASYYEWCETRNVENSIDTDMLIEDYKEININFSEH